MLRNTYKPQAHTLFISISTKTRMSYTTAEFKCVYRTGNFQVASKRHVSEVDAALDCGAEDVGSSHRGTLCFLFSLNEYLDKVRQFQFFMNIIYFKR